jgi:hypothetical protein
MDYPAVWGEQPLDLHPAVPAPPAYNPASLQDYGPEQAFQEDCQELFF